MTGVIIGGDPHKLSATIEVVDSHGKLLGSGRFATDRAGYSAMRSYVNAWSDHVWAVEGANGAGRPLAQRLVEAGDDAQGACRGSVHVLTVRILRRQSFTLRGR